MSDSKNILSSKVVQSAAPVAALNAVVLIQHILTGGSLLALDPAIIVNGLSFIGSAAAIAFRYFSDGKKLRIKTRS